MDLYRANKFLHSETNNELSLQKGNGYFYFTSNKGSLPKSIMTQSIKNVDMLDLICAVKYFKDNN